MLLALSIVLCPLQSNAAAKPKLSAKSVSLTVGKTKTLKVKNTKKKARWSVKSGKKYIKLKAKKKTNVKLVGVKKGTAKVQCKIGKKKLVCKVKVTEGKKADISAQTVAPEVTGVPVTKTSQPRETIMPVPKETVTPMPAATVSPRPTHIPTANRLMKEPLKGTESDTVTEDGFPIWYPYGTDYFFFYGSDIYRSDIEKITFVDHIAVPHNILGTLDLSDKQNESVMAWYTDQDQDGYYEMTIGQEGGVIANPDLIYVLFEEGGWLAWPYGMPDMKNWISIG